MPWVILIMLGVLAMWTFVLGRTRLGRYIYAIGGNPEAARRAGINFSLIRTAAFSPASLTAGIAGIIYASRLRSVSTNLDGGTLVLYAVAAAVIGGTSLFGGRGKARDAVLGGIVIRRHLQRYGPQRYSTAARLVVTAVVLLVAVTIDALARRGRTTWRPWPHNDRLTLSGADEQVVQRLLAVETSDGVAQQRGDRSHLESGREPDADRDGIGDEEAVQRVQPRPGIPDEQAVGGHRGDRRIRAVRD